MIDYKHSQGLPFKPDTRSVWPVLPVCQYLLGAEWDETALAAVSTLRPSFIRVVTPGSVVTDDAVSWRVTVFLGADGTINWIDQEVQASVPLTVKHGAELHAALRAKCINGLLP